MVKITDASMLSIEVEEVKKVIYHFEIRKREYSLVKVYRDGILSNTLAYNADGYNITSPLVVEMLEEVIEESK
jgi:hypothetical protein